MGNLLVSLEVPKVIEQGLATGNLQRVGGVIVEKTSRQVVAWLRDGSVTHLATDTLPFPLSAIMKAAHTGATLWDGKLTRNAVKGVSQQVAEVGSQIQSLQNLASFTVQGQVLNLALSAATFYATMERLDRLSSDIARLGEVVRAEFARDRDIRFKTALEAARDAFESDNPGQREKAGWEAKDGLFAARENFLAEFHEVLQRNITEDSLLIAQHCLIRAMYAETSRIRCFIAANEFKLAEQKLRESTDRFKKACQDLVQHWLGKHPAIYFHPQVDTQNLDRFISVQKWLRNDDVFSTADDAHILFEIIDELRKDFWNNAVVEDEYSDPLNRLRRIPSVSFQDRISRQLDHLGYAEVVVENYHRLVGFGYELQSMRSNFDEWNRLISEEEVEEAGVGIIYDEELLGAARQRLQQP